MKWILSCVGLLLSFVSLAQVDARSAAGHVVIKYAPLSMFDTDNTVQFGVEIPFGISGLSFQQDLGYGTSDFNIWYQDVESAPDKTIYKSHSSLRYYYYDTRRVRGYVAAEYVYKKVMYRENQWVGRDCSGFGTCGFFENMDFKISRVVGAVQTKMGWQFYFPGRLTLDLFTGVGFRRVRVRSLTPGVEDTSFRTPYEIWSDTTPGPGYIVPSLTLGFHLGIVLGKFKQ